MWAVRRAAGSAEDFGGHCEQCSSAGGRKHPQQEFIQIDTTNILFICGGAFDGLDKYILRRTDKSALGFGSSLKDNSSEAEKALLRKVEPHDLVKFGLIPELIGRLPVITVLDDLDEDALVRVLKEPRNSLVKQYKELLSMDNVELNFTDEALHAIARKTIERKTGARGLRSVMESILLPIMYEVPTDATIIRVTVDEDTVEGGEAHLEYGAVRKRYKKSGRSELTLLAYSRGAKTRHSSSVSKAFCFWQGFLLYYSCFRGQNVL